MKFQLITGVKFSCA